MKLLTVGVDQKTAPTAVREALAFEGDRLDQGLERLGASFPRSEFAILSTCNRVEVYSAAETEDILPAPDKIAEFLADFHACEINRFRGALVHRYDEDVVSHLFRVSASLESVVLGEGQILGQVREAYRAAERKGTIGAFLHHLFQEAIRVGKKVREATGIDQGRLSTASVAVDLAGDVFDSLSDKTVLVVGAGKMGDLTLQRLYELKPRRVIVTNRDVEKARAAAALWNAEAAPFDRLHALLIEADVVISTTAAPEPIVKLEHYRRVQRARRNRLSLILDIAVPRDFDAAIGELEQVLLYNVDDLKAQALENLKKRTKGIDPAERIIEYEAGKCSALLTHRRMTGKVLQGLGDYADQIRERELEKLFAGGPEFDERQREAIARLAMRLQNSFLHHPRSALRSAIETVEPEHSHSLLAAVRRLFGLDRDASEG